MDEQQRREALLEMVREVVPKDAPPARPVPPPRNGRAVLALLVGWAFLGYLWIARPSWVFGPPSTRPVLTADRRDALLRFTLYLQRARVEEYAHRTGHYPTDLASAGSAVDGVLWTPGDDGYTLTGQLRGQTLLLTNRMNADSFLGHSLEVLRQ